ncbi:MAG: TSUP family transporter [Candidatus Omnitrophica bacterium]|nr:TSUP family transporter [Candidatus Omnitrophota bacterium]
MLYLVISMVSLVASGLTLFSGFGLGTILMPVFAVFFPVEAAIALTALVHFANNIFKLFFVGRPADWPVVLRFGLPAIAAAVAGAYLLVRSQQLPSIAVYELMGRTHEILWIKVIVAGLMVVFALLEVVPGLQKIQFEKKYLPLGGLLSGFFGGVSGHQGALRSAFLIKCGLSKESFIATGVVIACLIDLPRLAVYSVYLRQMDFNRYGPALILAGLSAFTGVWAGSRLISKITIGIVQNIVGGMLLAVAVLLGTGII